MLGYFPNPHPDELLYSLLARLSRTLGHQGDTSLSSILFRKADQSISLGLPHHLGALAQQLPPGHLLNVEKMIQELSLYPFLTLFHSPEARKKIKTTMEMGSLSETGLRQFELPQELQFCMACHEEDLEHYGEAYWHRQHHLPRVTRCGLHETRLRRAVSFSRERASSRPGLRNLYLPDEVDRSEEVASWETGAFIFRYEKMATQLSNNRFPALTTEEITSRYSHHLKARGFAGAGRSLRLASTPLFEALQHRYGSVLERFGFGMTLPQLRQDLRRLTSGLRPLTSQHLLLVDFLGLTVEDFWRSIPQKAPVQRFPCRNPVSACGGKATVEGFTRTLEGRLVFACLSCGYTYTTKPSERECNQLGEAIDFHLLRVGEVWMEALYTLWKNASLSVEEIGYRLGASRWKVLAEASAADLPIVERPDFKGPYPKTITDTTPFHLRSRQAFHREKLVRLLEENSRATRGEVIKLLGSSAEWLRDNDNAWLKEHLPERAKRIEAVDWHDRDQRTSTMVLQAAHQITSALGLPQKITQSAILRLLPKTEAGSIRTGRPMPLTKQTLEQVLDSEADIAAKRFTWALATLQINHRQIPTFVKFYQEFGLIAYVLQSSEQHEQIRSAHELARDSALPASAILTMVGLPEVKLLKKPPRIPDRA